MGGFSEAVSGAVSTDSFAREQAFFDSHYADSASRTAQMKYYAALSPCRDRYFALVRQAAFGKRLLDYCCGVGETAFGVGPIQAEIVGIDLSAEAVERANARARHEGANARFVQGDAHATGMEAESFDVVASTGVIHHLDPARAFTEIHRLLKPGGQAIFVEALGHNPLINLYRRVTPKSRSPDEHPLKRSDFRSAEKLFASVTYEFYGLTALAGVFLPPKLRAPAFGALQACDKGLLSVPGLRWLAWVALVHLKK